MSNLDKEQVLEKFSAAYQKANGKAPSIEAKGGWYSVDGGKNVRLAQLDELANELTSTNGTEETVAAPAAKAEKKVAAKKTAAKKTTKTKSSFDVKAFWADKIKAANGANTLPR